MAIPIPGPGTVILLFIIGGIATVITFTAYKYAESEGPDISTWLPKPPELLKLPDIPRAGK